MIQIYTILRFINPLTRFSSRILGTGTIMAGVVSWCEQSGHIIAPNNNLCVEKERGTRTALQIHDKSGYISIRSPEIRRNETSQKSSPCWARGKSSSRLYRKSDIVALTWPNLRKNEEANVVQKNSV